MTTSSINNMEIVSYLCEFARDSEYERNRVGVGNRDVVRSSPDYGTVLCVETLGFFVKLPIPGQGNVIQPREGRDARSR